MNPWFRWYSGTTTDPKLALIAHKAEQPRTAVIAVWAALLEHANQADERGDISRFDPETLAIALDLNEDAIHAIISAMTAKGMIEGQRIAAWDKRQPKNREYLRPNPEDWKLIRQDIFERDDFTCQYCGARGIRLECDHVIPVSRGGSSEYANLVTACLSCNRSKGTKLVVEWREVAS